MKGPCLFVAGRRLPRRGGAGRGLIEVLFIVKKGGKKEETRGTDALAITSRDLELRTRGKKENSVPKEENSTGFLFPTTLIVGEK